MASTEAGSTSQSQHDTESASDVALSHRDDSSSQAEEEENERKLTPKWLLSFFSKDWKHYYRTFELNEKLYLHFKGKFLQHTSLELQLIEHHFQLMKLIRSFSNLI